MPNYRGTSTFVVPRGVVLRRVAAGRIHAVRWEVYEGDEAPAIEDWDGRDARWLGDVVSWRDVRDAGWSWQPKDGETKDFPSVGGVANVLSQIASALRFEQAYAERSGITVEQLRSTGRIVVPCKCGEESCEGWQSVNKEDEDHGTESSTQTGTSASS
jgi:hypothetical protein